MKTKSLQTFLVLCCLALSLSCEKEEQLIRSEESIKTVSLDQALEVMKSTQQKISAKSNSNFITSISEEVNYEAITNTDEQLVVIPVTTAYKNLYSRIVLLEIEDKLQSAILSLNTFESTTRDNFSGEILITDMNGNFIKGLRIENNTVVSHYIKSDIKTDKKNLSFNTSNAKSDCDNGCPFSVCDYCTLDEVVVTVPSQPNNTYISIEVMFPERDLGLNLGDYDYNYGGGSGSTKDPDEEEENKRPCPGDPVPNPEIVSSGASGKQGGTFGCTRQGDNDCQPPFDKEHDGMDIKAEPGSSAFAMYSGTVLILEILSVQDNI